MRTEVLALVAEESGDPAEFVPADVNVYVRIESGAGILDADDSNPLSKEAWNAIQDAIPGGLWEAAATKLGMDERTLLKELFTRDLCLVDQTIADRRRLVVVTTVDSKILAKLPEAAGLEPWSEQPNVGPFRLYRGASGDREYLLAVGERRLVFSSTGGADHVRRILVAKSAGEPLLVDHEAYRDLLSRLPQKRSGVMFTQSRDGDEAHALALIHDGKRLEARYAARAPNVKKYIEALQSKKGVDFGPLPADVVAAVSFNMVTKDVPAEGVLDMLLFPYSFRRRVLPNIEPPMLVFLGKVPREDIRPDPGFHVPVFGVALRLNDPKVAADLDRICSGIHFLVSISQFALREGFFGVEEIEQTVDKEELTYHRADFGPILRATGKGTLLAKLASLPNAKGLTRIAFGRIGDFYVICTQEAFFRRWKEAESGHATRLSGADDFAKFEFQDHDGLILSALTRGRELSELVNEAIAFLEQSGEQDDSSEEKPDKDKKSKAEDEKSKDDEDTDKITKPLQWLANGLEESKTFSVQVWHTDDGLLHGRLVVLR
jgi:hypothetical protein